MSRVAYILRTDSLSRESRVAKLASQLKLCGGGIHVFAMVKKEAQFAHAYTNILCAARRVRIDALRHLLKAIELQIRCLLLFFRYRAAFDTFIVANYEFILAGILSKVVLRTPVVVDLHEHYAVNLFSHRWFSRLIFLRILNGVIFANAQRKEEFLGDIYVGGEHAVAIVRNFPDTEPVMVVNGKSIPTPLETIPIRVGIIGATAPGRFVEESINCMDAEEFKGLLKLHSFGPSLEVTTDHLTLIQHGPFRHDEIDRLIATHIDISLVFYDPVIPNHRLCEPNRFFQAYNQRKIIFCFEHASLSEFYDEAVFILDPKEFNFSFKNRMSGILNASTTEKVRIRNAIESRSPLKFADGVEHLDSLVLHRRRHTY